MKRTSSYETRNSCRSVSISIRAVCAAASRCRMDSEASTLSISFYDWQSLRMEYVHEPLSSRLLLSTVLLLESLAFSGASVLSDLDPQSKSIVQLNFELVLMMYVITVFILCKCVRHQQMCLPLYGIFLPPSSSSHLLTRNLILSNLLKCEQLAEHVVRLCLSGSFSNCNFSTIVSCLLTRTTCVDKTQFC